MIRSFPFGSAVRAMKHRLFDRLQPANAYRGVFGSFEEAGRHAPTIKPLGYDSANAGSWYRERMATLQVEDYPVAYWLREAFQSASTLLEIGGHVGVAYYGMERVAHYPTSLSWTILDVPSVVTAGEALAQENGRSDLHFIADIAAAPAADILVAAGSLQYFEDESLAPTLEALPKLPAHILVNTTPIHDGRTFVTLQNISTAYCPYRIFNRARFVGDLERMGYRVRDTWRIPRRLEVPGHPDLGFDHFSGLYLQREG